MSLFSETIQIENPMSLVQSQKEPYIYETDGCKHEFLFDEETSNPTCLRTHKVTNCIKCNVAYDKASSNARELFYSMHNESISADKPIFHFCIFRSDGTCGSLLTFPTMANGDNYGFDKKPYGMVSNNERRKCHKCREIKS
jgi:hypothetical protein